MYSQQCQGLEVMLLCIEPDLSLLEGLKAAVDKHIFGEESHFLCKNVCSNYILNFAVSVLE